MTWARRAASACMVVSWAGFAHAESEDGAWWLLVEDLGCDGCRAEVDVAGVRVVEHPSGSKNLLVELGDRVVPGSTQIQIRIHGSQGSGIMAVSVAHGTARHEVVVFDDSVVRYALQPEPDSRPLHITVPISPAP